MTMKKYLSLLLALAMMLSILTACGDTSSSEDGTFLPSESITWYCTSSPGGGSDIFSRMITDIATTNDLANGQTFVVDNKTDGSGEVGRLTVATTRAGDQADHTLLTFNSGDLMPMCQNTDNRVENFTPIAIMAVDKQLLFKGEDTPYATFEEVLAAVESGTAVTIGGSKGDDIATYEALVAELGFDETQMPYITYDGTADAITALLGGHIDLLISKPASASEYVEAGMIEAILALSNERYTGNLANAPTLSEVADGKYENVEVPVWRGVVGPGDMSDEAAAYWSEVLRQVSESEKWQTDYLDKNMLISNYMDLATTQEYMAQYQADYLASIGKDK